jgi:hypothetical protein
MIIGVTHDPEGRAVQRLSVSTKVAIGMPPQGNRNYPSKLDHFVFLRKEKTPKGVEWEPDPELMQRYGSECRAVQVMLIDDDIETVFPTAYAWWTATERKCWGDGTRATRRTPGHPSGEPWTPCGGQCPELAAGLCKPGGDLRFVLADFPRLGSVCRIHTSSYRSIRQIHSALEEIQTFTGGRLAGITAKLVVRPEEATYFDRKENRKKTTTIWALSLEVDGEDIRKLVANLTGNARLFAETRKLLGWGDRAIEVVEDEGEQAPEITAEFYPSSENGSVTGEPSSEGNAASEAAAAPAVREPRPGPASAGSNDRMKRAPKPPIKEAQRKAETVQRDNKAVDTPKPANGTNGCSSQTAAARNAVPTSVANGSQPKLTKLRGVVGPLEPDTAGNTVRRNGRGVEYVVFKMGHNGTATTIYCNHSEMMPEIVRRQGREAAAQVEVTGNGSQPYHILNAFVEG